MKPRERFLRAVRHEPIDRPPVWLMRQAGRYLPDYRAVRAQHGFWDVCKTPALSTRVALEPMSKFKLDAAIVFSDILVIPDALDLDVTFGTGDGPKVGRPLRTADDLAAWNTRGIAERLAYVPNAAADLRKHLGDDHAILGFCGAPWTLFCYIVEGGGSDDFKTARTMLHTQPELSRRALDTLADAAADLLVAEHAAGVDCIQIFDTWGGLLAADEYRAFALPSIARLAARMRERGCPSILFVRGGHHLLPSMNEAGVDVLSLDWRTTFTEARRAQPKLALQGNIDPVLLFAGDDVVRARTRSLMGEIQAHGGTGAIVNLGHGILPGTPESAVGALVDEVVRGF